MWESEIALCFIVRYFMSILVLQLSWWGRESWLLCLICLPGVSWWLSGSSSWCHGVVCGLWLWYFLIIHTYNFWISKVLLSLTDNIWIDAKIPFKNYTHPPNLICINLIAMLLDVYMSSIWYLKCLCYFDQVFFWPSICLFLMILFLPKIMINVTTLILK